MGSRRSFAIRPNRHGPAGITNPAALSAELVRRQTDYWFHNQEGAQDDDVAAYALMHVVYDVIDRLKQWESEAGIDGDKAFAEVCRGLQAEYDELEQSLAPGGRPTRGEAGGE